jgi:hypothetical protein
VRILIFFLVLPVLVFVCALIVYRMPLPARLDGSRDLIAAIAAGLTGMGALAGLVVYLLVSLRHASRILEPTLTGLGLDARWSLLGRRYTGTLAERSTRVTYRPAFALQPARLDVSMAAQLDQRLAAGTGPQRPLLDCRDCPRLEVPGLPGIGIYAPDEARTRAWLDRPGVEPALFRALGGLGVSGTSELYLQPERLWLRARFRAPADAIASSRFTRAVKDLMPALQTLLEAAE